MLLKEDSIQADAIKLVLDIEDVPNEHRKDITQKIVVSLQAAIQSMRKKD